MWRDAEVLACLRPAFYNAECRNKWKIVKNAYISSFQRGHDTQSLENGYRRSRYYVTIVV